MAWKFPFIAKKKNIITAIDIGSSSIKGLVAQQRPDGQTLGVLTHFSLPSNGMRKGAVVDSDNVSEQIEKVVIKLKTIAKPHKLTDVYINLNGSHINSMEGYGAVAISRADQKVSYEDIERVNQEAKNINLPFNQEILEIFPTEYIIDGQTGLTEVEGMKGIKLEVRALAVSAFSLHVKKLIDAVLSADINIVEPIISPIAASRAVLTAQQKELGAAVVDIGAETTGIAVFEEKKMIHLAILPVGSDNITRDIAIALQTDIEIAEAIKKKFGGHLFKNKRKQEKIDITDGEIFEFDSKKMVKAGRARVSEILNLVSKELKKIKREQGLPAGIVLTGGGSNLSGLVGFTKDQLKLPVRKGVCIDLVGMEQDSAFSVASGLALLGADNRKSDDSGGSSSGTVFRRIFETFKP
ncbi:cell division protein FtsA [Patescibacteria group bacterium]|nr:cell division protein FtsA [Patescibacteria group bacterium]MBU4022927.1 cell division protein FtsA [Patescibacteria group bacterium]MBU4078299.1 cell division protein FtsA [Patescibacteria group bacterium]